MSDRCSSYREVLELQGGVGATEMCQRSVGATGSVGATDMCQRSVGATGSVGATEMCQRGVGERMSQVSGGWGVVEAVD